MIVKKNKRGDIFALYFPFLILALCGIIIFAFVYNQNQINTSLASPEAILRLEDEKQIFEYNERMLIDELNLDSTNIKTANKTFCTNLEPYSKFLTSNLILNNKKFDQSFWDQDNQWMPFCQYLYTFTIEGDIITIKRRSSQKQILLEPEVNKEIGFNTKLVFTHSNSYTININDKT